ncbi:MAG: saccharopine dehydrogenase [Pseudooceanicola sp.]|nr:saccharopine dehydrogenase [Pseudooceanicola sp.]|tara:strand:- start:12 stop:1067 length:1056 start_codon:yes stop_codon:yes gene_type:complete
MTHIWVRAEQRENETRTGITPQGVAALIAAGKRVTVENSASRVLPIDGFRDAGATIAPENGWPDAPDDAVIFGLKELPEDGTPLRHRHIMFGHAYKDQAAGKVLLKRFKAGGGTLLDLEYLTDDAGRRVAAFGYWAGFAGAAVALSVWAAQQAGRAVPPAHRHATADDMVAELTSELDGAGVPRPNALVIGALGRVGTGAADLCARVGVTPTRWDMAETASGGPFPEILDHGVFLNCILARRETPRFVTKPALTQPRALRVIGDIACDPDSPFNPIPLYDRATTWEKPAVRVHDDPTLDIMAIDNLPSMLPLESSQDFAGQLLPTLLTLGNAEAPVWARANALFQDHVARV